ncbi:MAG: type II secretion system protein GspF, partial [Oceanicoccus sp.]|nr:type II secretion system protein GspF [Oceanicoccus sp.]
MASFSYAALDDNGKEQKGIIEADTPRQVRQILRDRGLAPLQVDSAQLKTASNDGANVGEAYATPSLFNRGPSIKVGELATITRQLATLIQSSMP